MTAPLDTLIDLTAALPIEDLRVVVVKAVHDRMVAAGDLREAADVPRRSQRTWRLLTEEVESGAWSGAEAFVHRARLVTGQEGGAGGQRSRGRSGGGLSRG